MMMKYARFDDNGLPVGFYDEDIHGPILIDGLPNSDSLIPAEAVKITEQQWRALIDNQGERRWEGGNVVAYDPPTPPVTVDMIKAEARRRILLIMNEDKQRNTLAASMQYGADPANWPEDLQVRQVAAMEAWSEIERLRARSNEIEAMDPIPADITDEGLWK